MISDFQHKIDFLSRNISPAILQSLHKEVQTFFTSSSSHTVLSPAMMESLTLNLGYSLIKNHRWLGDALFQEIVTHFIASHYMLDNETAQNLFDNILIQFSSVFTFSRSDDAQFKKFLLVFILTSEDENSLLRQFGFGSAIFEKIRAIVLAFEDTRGDPVRFTTPLEQQFVEELVNLSQEKSKCAWVEQIYRLRYILGTDAAAENIFRLLLQLGEKKSCLENSLKHDFDNIAAVLRDLSQKQLVHALGRKRWQLSPLGSSITASAFASSEQAQRLLKDGNFSHLSCEYQIAMLRHLQIQDPGKLHQLLFTRASKLAPKVYAAGLELYLREEKNFTDIETSTIAPLSAWHRKAVCGTLSKYSRHAKVRQILENLAQSDDSEVVREEALKGIISTQ